MNALFKISASEFNHNLFLKLKDLLGQATDSEIIISIKEKKDSKPDADGHSYLDSLDKSINEMNKGDFVSFSMEEFELYVAKQFGE